MKTIILALTIAILALWIQAPHPHFHRNFLTGESLLTSKKAYMERLIREKRFLGAKTDTELTHRELQDVTSQWAYEYLEPLISNFPDWANVKENDFSVKDVSGGSGAKTYMLKKIDDGKRLFLKVNYVGTTNQIERFKKVSQVLMEENPQLTPTIVFAEDSNNLPYYIQEDGGSDFKKLGADPEILGTLLAKIHSVDRTWYDPFRQELVND